MAPRYSDDEFLDLLDTENWTSCFSLSNRIGCTFQTANRRLIQLVDEGTVEIADPENDTYDRPETDHPGRPMLYYRKVPDNRDPLTGEIEAEAE